MRVRVPRARSLVPKPEVSSFLRRHIVHPRVRPLVASFASSTSVLPPDPYNPVQLALGRSCYGSPMGAARARRGGRCGGAGCTCQRPLLDHPAVIHQHSQELQGW